MRRGPRGDNAAPILGILTALLLCCAMPAVAAANTTGGLNTFRPWPVLLIMVLIGLRYAWLVASAQVRLFEMSAWLFGYVFMGLAPFVQLRNNVQLDTVPYIEKQLVPEAALVVIIGSGAMMLGTLLVRRSPDATVASLRPELNGTRLRLLAVGSWLIEAYYLSLLGGPSVLFMSRFELSDRTEQVFSVGFQGVIIDALANMGLLVSAVGLVLYLRALPKSKRPPLDIALAGIQVILVLIVINPISSARYVFGTAFLALVGAFGGFGTLRRFRVVALSAIGAFLVVFPLMDAFRVSTDAAVTVTGPFAAMESGDFDAFFQTVNTVEFVHAHGSTHGAQLLGVVLFAVPRMLWRAKPTDTGILLANFKGYSFTNLSSPLWAEMFINGGWVFLVIGMTLVGMALRIGDNAIQSRRRAGLPLPVPACILPFYLLILMRGSLLQAMAPLTVIICLYLFVRNWEALGGL